MRRESSRLRRWQHKEIGECNMSRKSRLDALERCLPEDSTRRDAVYPYVITAEYFDHICRELHGVFEPPPDIQELLKTHTPEQARECWLRHYSYWENGILKDPPPEWIEVYHRFASMSLHDWYESILCEILKFPHRLEFDLDEFGLANWKSRIESCSHIAYNPVGPECPM